MRLMNVKKNAKNVITCLALILTLTGCTLDVNLPRHDTGPHDISYVEVALCYDEPYWDEPEWCDVYNNAECCTWYIDGWYEEWCDWGYDGCWEYFGSY